MATSRLSPFLITLSASGFYLLWVVMGLNGTIEALVHAKNTGFFPTGRPLTQTYTRIPPIDFVLVILVGFFDSLVNMHYTAPYLILLDLVATLYVINLMTLVEDRRAERSSWLRLPSIWQYLWNIIGVAVFFPLHALYYVKQGHASISAVPEAEAQAIPFTALWSLLLPLPLMLPGLIRASPSLVQLGVVFFYLTPPMLVAFQDIAAGVISRYHYRGATTPIRASYVIVGAVSGLVHVGILLYAATSSQPNMSIGRVYFPDYAAVQRGDPEITSEGTALFIKYDLMIIHIVVLTLGAYIFGKESQFLAKTETERIHATGSIWRLALIVAAFGPGAGLAFVLYSKETHIDRLYGHSRSSPKNKVDVNVSKRIGNI
jgi:hypothetical protein